MQSSSKFKVENTIFKASAENLAGQLQEAAFDFPAFERQYRPCELERCRATCCHDGVHLSEEDAEIVAEVVRNERDSLEKLGMKLPLDCLEVSERGRRKTKTRSAQNDEVATDYPAHFPKTKCVFLDEKHRCSLQRLAVEKGKHPWYYKPITCWMHPVTLQKATEYGGRPLLTLFSPETDPQKTMGYPGFASCTHCGREDNEGVKGEECFAKELEMLSLLSDRSFC